jgi:hypothetical protein
VHHGIHAFERPVERTCVAHVGLDDLDFGRRRPVPAGMHVGAQGIHDPNLGSAAEEFAHDVLADEAGATGDENDHRCR